MRDRDIRETGGLTVAKDQGQGINWREACQPQEAQETRRPGLLVLLDESGIWESKKADEYNTSTRYSVLVCILPK